MVDHDHGLKCTGCNVQPGECCRHCPAAIAAEEAAAQPNAALRAQLEEVLDIADRAGVPLRYASVNATVVTLQGGTGTYGYMSLDDAVRIAALIGDEHTLQLADEVCNMSAIRATTRSGVRVVMLCQPTRAQLTSIPAAVTLP